MTPQEFRQELIAFRKSIGPEAYVSAGITGLDWDPGTKGTLDCTIYPNGLTRDRGSFTVYAEDWAKLLAAVKAKWETHQGEHRKQMVRKLALAIIRITADLGRCTDAALRSEFTKDQIKEFGALAISDANKMAANGPFEIVKTRGANGAPDDIEVRDPARIQ